MSLHTTRAERRQLERENQNWPVMLKEIPPRDWPASTPPGLLRVLRSRDFLVQIYSAPAPAIYRLSANRTSLDGSRWSDLITWDELQRLKREAGYSSMWAVEIYPPDDSAVNVANMRHLWLTLEAPAFAWRART